MVTKGNVTGNEPELKSLLEGFGDLPEPRSERTQDHPLLSILRIGLCAVISGADNWVDMASYGKVGGKGCLSYRMGFRHRRPLDGCFGSSIRKPFKNGF